MTDLTRTTRFRFWLWLIRFIGVIVPRRLRADWRQEWEAELRYREELLAEWDRLDWSARLALLWHSAGAFMDALWLQPRRLEDEMFQDLRYGARMLAKNPGFTLIAIITLALGIGANTAIFSVVNAVLLRPLPYRDPDQLVRVWGNNTRQGSQPLTASLPDYLDWRAQNQVFGQMAAFSFVGGSGNEQQYPNTNAGYGVSLVPLHETVTGDAEPALGMLLGAVAFVLLIACANVANLLLSRAAARQKEMAVRSALGAGRFRLVLQLLTESLLLSLLGGGAGLLLARWGIDSLVALSADKLPRADQIAIDGWVLAFTLVVTILTGILFGLAPAFQASRLNLQESLKAGGLTSAVMFSRFRLRDFLVISEVALALMLLIGAGLLIKSFYLLQRVDPGLDPNHVLTMRVALPASKYSQGERMGAFYRELVQRAGSLPGVRSAGVVSWLPMSGQRITTRLAIEGRPASPSGEELSTDYRVISPGYFRVVGASLLKGRELSERDNEQAPAVLVINEAMANRFWPQEDPLGKSVTVEMGQPVSCEVVGVIRDIKEFGPADSPTPVVYGSYLQRPWIGVETRELVVRTATAPLNLVAAVRSEARAMDKDVPVYNVSAMSELLAGATAQPRFSLILLGLFAAAAFAMAIAGLYAVVAYSVSQRTREIGIRLALGARGRDVLKLVARQGLALLLIGVAIGLAGASAATRVMKTLLFEVSATDPLAFAGIPLLLAVVALLACWIPARRATKVDPLTALRHE